MNYQVIQTGSKGNCEIAMNYIMIDIGVSFSKIKPYVNDIKIVFLSHLHLDHLNIKTLKKLQSERPTLRVACGEWMLDKLEGINNIDVLDLGKWYNYGTFRVSIGKSYHDVPNCFFRFDFNGFKVFRATDTVTLDGITAKDYDIYAIESNYDQDKAEEAIKQSQITGEFCHALGSVNSHLSHQQAFEFFVDNKREDSIFIKLHKSESYG